MFFLAKMLSVAVHEDYAKSLDRVIKLTGAYSSRSEFLKDAIRKNFEEMLKMDADLRSIHESAKKFAAEARARGYKGGLLSKRERTKIAKEYLRERGIKF